MLFLNLIIFAVILSLLSGGLESKPLRQRHRSDPGGLIFNHPHHPKTVFKLHRNIKGHDFFRAFRWETEDDPTHGRVNYVDIETAKANNLTHATENKFTMRVDSQNVVLPSARGRNSNRISSLETYTDSVLVLDVQHVPDSICGVWPAFWTVTASGNWPNGGEIDIYEGVNLNSANLASLHTSANCTMPNVRKQTGASTSTDCYAFANSNQGCGTQFTKPRSYGTVLNQVGGGWFVMKRTQEGGVQIWFWGRNDYDVPFEIATGLDVLTAEVFRSQPDASFPSTDTCNFADHFDAHTIVFDTTLCGDWAGNVYQADGCGASYHSCEDFVNNKPGAFENAYWEINALRVYTPGLPW